MGGCVRDALLSREVTDFDIATSATPDEVESLFEKTQDLGKAFGTIRVFSQDICFEVTSFRREGPYSDGRHPDFVEQGMFERRCLSTGFYHQCHAL